VLHALNADILGQTRCYFGGGTAIVLLLSEYRQSLEDMYAEKLLANADRGLDTSTLSRDIIDLAMMIGHWGAIPDAAWEKAKMAYGNHVVRAFETTSRLVCDRAYLSQCLHRLDMDIDLAERIPVLLGQS